MQNVAAMPLFYFPPISYWQAAVQAGQIFLNEHERYQKQTYRNRCYIVGPNGVQPLVVPIKHLGRPKTVAECHIDYSLRWVPQHLGAIKTAYGKAPFFIYYIDAVAALLEQKPATLAQLNRSILTQCLHLLKLTGVVQVLEDSHLPAGPNTHLKVLNLPETRTNGRPAALPTYPQVFGKDFESDCSVLDLLFCNGTRARDLLTLPPPRKSQ